MQKEKIESINGLKGISCLIIMLYHYRFFLLDKGIWIINYGHYFVEVFVAISGFLMAYNYRERLADMNFKDFFLKRYLKIMPLYWITEICMYIAEFLAVYLSGKRYHRNPLQVIWEFSGLYTGWFGQSEPPLNNPLWTVSCLLMCYVLYYFICKVSKKSNYIYLSLIFFVICCAWSALGGAPAEKHNTITIGNLDLIQCILSFMMGVLFYEVYRRIPERWGQIISWVLVGLLIGILIVLCVCNINNIGFTEKSIASIVIALFCPLMLCFAVYIRTFRYIFSAQILQSVGKLAMDIYMWHWVVRVYMGSRPIYLNERTWSGWVVLIAVSLLTSVVSHYILMPWIYDMEMKIKQFIRR